MSFGLGTGIGVSDFGMDPAPSLSISDKAPRSGVFGTASLRRESRTYDGSLVHRRGASR